MALGIVTRTITKLGREVFRGKTGRFISESTYLKELRRSSAGRFVSKAQYFGKLENKGFEQYLRGVYNGSPIGGGDWVSRVQASSERFVDVIAEYNQLSSYSKLSDYSQQS